METVDMRDFKIEALKRKVKEAGKKLKKNVDDVVAWGAEHPGEALALATLVLGTAKKVSGSIQSVAENHRRELDLYDPRTGRHSMLRRPLTPKEKLIIDERYSRGESYVRILYDMGLLK